MRIRAATVSVAGGADSLRSRIAEIADELEPTHKDLDAKRELIKAQPTLEAKQPLCVPKTLSVLMEQWNHLSWRNDRAALFRSGRHGLAIQVEGTA
jgi:hypothetical protein